MLRELVEEPVRRSGMRPTARRPTAMRLAKVRLGVGSLFAVVRVGRQRDVALRSAWET